MLPGAFCFPLGSLIPHGSFSDCPHSSQNCVLCRPPFSLYPCCLQELPCGCPAHHADSLCPETCSTSFLLGWPCSCAPTLGGGTVTCPLLRTAACPHPWLILPSRPPLLPVQLLADFCQFCVLNPVYIHPDFSFCAYHDSVHHQLPRL